MTLESQASSLPFAESIIDDRTRLRTFAPNTAHDELIWHRDKEHRIVQVLEGKGWMMQVDGRLPVPMTPGEVHVIPKETWHRVIREDSATHLTVEITEVSPEEMVGHVSLDSIEERSKKRPGNPNYYKGTRKSNKQMSREINKCAKPNPPKSCYDEWSADKSYKKSRKGSS
jgi:gentisate 1,2-dioxygenase